MKTFNEEAGEGYCKNEGCGNICLVDYNHGCCYECRNYNVRFGTNTEHDTYTPIQYDRSYRSYTQKGYNRKDTEYDCDLSKLQ